MRNEKYASISGKNSHLYKHGLSRSKFFNVWVNMIRRCNHRTNPFYKQYGGREIIIEWLSFIEFKDDMYDSYLIHKKHNKSTTIERIDNNGNYCKENCKWATAREQMWNTRQVRMMELNGESKPFKVWCKELGIVPQTIRYRMKNGLDFKRAIHKPLNQRILINTN